MAIAVPGGGIISNLFDRLELVKGYREHGGTLFPGSVELLVTKLEYSESI